MTRVRSAVLACAILAVGVPAAPQVAPPGPSGAGAGARAGAERSSVPRDGSRTLAPNAPRWGGGPPPPGPFDRVPGTPSVFLTPRPGVDAFRARPGTYAPRYSPGPRHNRGWRDDKGSGPRSGRRRSNGSGVIYPPLGAVYIGASPYYYPGVVPPTAQPSDLEPRQAAEGFLRLVVTPRNAGVFVDGVYEGTVDDFGGAGERVLPAGIHAVRIEADGFEPVAFDVRVPVNDTITLRRDLDPRRTPPLPPPAAAPATPKTIYLIPRCYLGDSRPQPGQLPAGCNLADLRTLD